MVDYLVPAPPAGCKLGSVLYPPELAERARSNAEREPWVAEQRQRLIAAARPWLAISDDELWVMMFGNTITRSWMVWSNGHCPACRGDTAMYAWKMDPLAHPWKTQCPHCGALFPTNDFHAFYRSGLDEQNVFQPARADRLLLFNADHPDPADPLHGFGVDDGEGYTDGEHRWRFIGAYLVFGQWKGLILAGIRLLPAAYFLTGEGVYAHKAAVLLDRVADLFPTFDYGREGLGYEQPDMAGYISTWHDSCREVRAMAEAYDQIFPALEGDDALVAFLRRKAREYRVAGAKDSIEAIRRNIEERIFRDAITHRYKIYFNYPHPEITLMTMLIVLGWPETRPTVMEMLDEVIVEGTAADGVFGEKGLLGYGSMFPRSLAAFLQHIARLEPDLLDELFARHPRLRQTWKFHLDLWFNGQYYPVVGDSAGFGARAERYAGVSFATAVQVASNDTPLPDSLHAFLHRLYRITGDADYLRILHQANGGTVEGMPYDFVAEDPAAMRREIAAVLDREGTAYRTGSVNKPEWHIAMLRAGRDEDARALWIEYDTGGRHGHHDAMNIGLFAKGLDLMPDFGYPAIRFGGWDSPRAMWYLMAAAHNTVVVDGLLLRDLWHPVGGETTLWADGAAFRAIRVSGPQVIGKRQKQFERTAALIDISARDSYVIDIFRVAGGSDHAKFQHSHFGSITTQGLMLQSGEDYGGDTMLRNFRTDPAPAPGWSTDWTIEDRYGHLPPGRTLHLRYTDLTPGASASVAEGWVMPMKEQTAEGAWIPVVMTRRRAERAPLASTFVALIEPYEEETRITVARRLPLENGRRRPMPENHVALEITLRDGARDLFLAAEVENPLALSPAFAKTGILFQPEWNVRLEGECGWLRRASDGALVRLALCRARAVTVDGWRITLKEETEYIEIDFSGEEPEVMAGDAEAVEEIVRIPVERELPPPSSSNKNRA